MKLNYLQVSLVTRSYENGEIWEFSIVSILSDTL